MPSKEGYVWVINDAENKMYVSEAGYALKL